MFIGICIGLIFGMAGEFVLFALLSVAKENDTFVEQSHFEGDGTDDRLESEQEKIKQEARKEFIDDLKSMTYEEIADLIEKGY